MATEPVIDVGGLVKSFGRHRALDGLDLLVLPGETYVEFQLAAQKLRPDSFVCVAGYGDGATGYVPTEKHRAEHDSNLSDWCWVAPGSEPVLLEAIQQVMNPPRP